MSGIEATRIVVAEDSLLIREGLVTLLSIAPNLETVATAGSLDEAREAVLATDPDLLITDVRMPPSHTDEGIRLACELRSTQPQLGIIVLSQFVESSYALDLLGDGVSRRGYLLKQNIDDEGRLFEAIGTVVAGGSYLDDAVVEALVRARTRSAGGSLDDLTAREVEVLAEVATGATNAVIARRLHVTANAIEKHSSSIFSKLGLQESDEVNRRVAAVLMYLARREVKA